MSDTTQKDTQDWEDEGGGTAPELMQQTPTGMVIPVPKRKDLRAAFRKLLAPVKKKP